MQARAPVPRAVCDQGLDAHHIIHSMDSRMDEVSKHIAMLTEGENSRGVSNDMMKNKRATTLHWNEDTSDEYPGSEEDEHEKQRLSLILVPSTKNSTNDKIGTKSHNARGMKKRGSSSTKK